MLDLGAWASGDYQVPEEPLDEDWSEPPPEGPGS